MVPSLWCCRSHPPIFMWCIAANSIMIKHEKGVQSSVNMAMSSLAWGNRKGEVLGRVLKGMMNWQEKRT